MSFESLWPHLSALHSDAQRPSPVEWKVLYASRARPLLVPAGNRAQARAAIDFFVPNRLLRWWGRIMLRLDDWLPHSHFLPLARSERFPAASIFGQGARFENCFAVHCGSPGPFRKLTIYCPGNAAGFDEEIAKVSAEETADDSVTREVHWLQTLGEVPELAPFLPRLLRHGTLPCGRRYMTMSVLPSGEVSSRFGAPHFRFLEALAQRRTAAVSWRYGAPFKRLHHRVQAVLGLLEPRYQDLFEGVEGEIGQLIGHLELPACLVHGDFAAWNVRVSSDQLLVFDWEYAEAQGNPLQDFLHFHLVARATGHRVVSSAFLRGLLERARMHAHGMFGEGGVVGEAAAALLLHYLLETVAFYTDASRFLDFHDPVVNAYLQALELRHEWMPRMEQAPGEVLERQ